MVKLRSPDGAVLYLPRSTRRADPGSSRRNGRALRSAGRTGSGLRTAPGPGDLPVVVLLLHGGIGEPDRRSVPAWWPPVLRMIALGPALGSRPWRPDRATDPVVTRLRYRARGWNAAGAEPIADARWAIARLQQRWPGSPIVLVGHSMGGRVGAALLAEPVVIGLVGLAAWLPPGEPVPDLTDRRVVLIHGADDREIPPAWSRAWSARGNIGVPATSGNAGIPAIKRNAGIPASRDRTGSAGRPVSVIVIPGTGHAMLRRWREWHRHAGRAGRQIAEHRPTDGG